MFSYGLWEFNFNQRIKMTDLAINFSTNGTYYRDREMSPPQDPSLEARRYSQRAVEAAVGPSFFASDEADRCPPYVHYRVAELKFSPKSFSFSLNPNFYRITITKAYEIALRLCGSGLRVAGRNPNPKPGNPMDLFNYLTTPSEDPPIERRYFHSNPREGKNRYVFACHPRFTEVEVCIHLKKAPDKLMISAVDYRCAHFAADPIKVLGYRLAETLGMIRQPQTSHYSHRE